jgi:hypothetical protein
MPRKDEFRAINISSVTRSNPHGEERSEAARLEP